MNDHELGAHLKLRTTTVTLLALSHSPPSTRPDETDVRLKGLTTEDKDHITTRVRGQVLGLNEPRLSDLCTGKGVDWKFWLECVLLRRTDAIWRHKSTGARRRHACRLRGNGESMVEGGVEERV